MGRCFPPDGGEHRTHRRAVCSDPVFRVILFGRRLSCVGGGVVVSSLFFRVLFVFAQEVYRFLGLCPVDISKLEPENVTNSPNIPEHMKITAESYKVFNETPTRYFGVSL